ASDLARGARVTLALRNSQQRDAERHHPAPVSDRRFGADASVEVDAGLFPLPLDGAFGDPTHRGQLDEGKAAEELEVHNFRQRAVDLGELIERVADPGELRLFPGALCRLAVKRGDLELPSAFARPAAAYIADNQAAHHSSRIAHEASLVGKRRPGPIGHVQVSLVEQGGDAQARTRPTLRQLSPGKSMQLIVEGS